MLICSLPFPHMPTESRDSLLLLAQSGLDVALAALPGLSKPSKILLAKVCALRSVRLPNSSLRASSSRCKEEETPRVYLPPRVRSFLPSYRPALWRTPSTMCVESCIPFKVAEDHNNEKLTFTLF